MQLRLRLDNFDRRKWNGVQIDLKPLKKKVNINWIKFNKMGEVIKISENSYIEFK